MPDLTPESLAELRRLLDECQPGRVIVNDLRPTHNAIWLDSRYDSDDGWESLRTLAEIDTETETVEVLWGLDDAVLIAAAINALPALLDAAAERDVLAADRDALLAIIDDARHALSADGPKVEPARQVLARALPQLTAWQDRKRRDRDITPPHVIAHRGAQLDAVTAERDTLRAERDALSVNVSTIAIRRALDGPQPDALTFELPKPPTGHMVGGLITEEHAGQRLHADGPQS